MQQEWMQKDQLKYQGTVYLSEKDLQDDLKEDGATQSLIKTGETVYKEEDLNYDILILLVNTFKDFIH